MEIKSRKGCLGLALKVKQLTRERETQMEALVFGLIVLNNLNNEQELIVPEPTEFRPFDLRTLEDLYNARDNSPSSSSDRKHPYVAQTVS